MLNLNIKPIKLVYAFFILLSSNAFAAEKQKPMTHDSGNPGKGSMMQKGNKMGMGTQMQPGMKGNGMMQMGKTMQGRGTVACASVFGRKGMGMMGSKGMGSKGMGMMGMMGMMGRRGMMGKGSQMAFQSLNKPNRKKIRKICANLLKTKWTIKGKMLDEKTKLAELYDNKRYDTNAIGKVYTSIFNYKRQIIEAKLNAKNSIRDVLDAANKPKTKK